MLMTAPEGSPRFPVTHWSVVVRAGGGESPEKKAALEALCQTYWYPLYAFARREGTSPEAAQDLVQGFLCRMLETGSLGAADPERGRFRSFLLTSFRNYGRNLAAKERALKRGGGKQLFSLEGDDPEGRLSNEPTHEATPEKLFTRDWALTLLRTVMDKLRADYAAKGQERLFAAAEPLLSGADASGTPSEQAEALGISANAFRVALHRLRKRYRDALYQEVAQTVSFGKDVEAELQELLAALAL